MFVWLEFPNAQCHDDAMLNGANTFQLILRIDNQYKPIGYSSAFSLINDQLHIGIDYTCLILHTLIGIDDIINLSCMGWKLSTSALTNHQVVFMNILFKRIGWKVRKKTLKTVQTEQQQVHLNHLKTKCMSFYNINNILRTFHQN